MTKIISTVFRIVDIVAKLVSLFPEYLFAPGQVVHPVGLQKSTHVMEEKENPKTIHKLELLGIGASKDRQLKANLLEALWQMGLDIPVEEVREIDRLLESGVSGIPALMVDGKVLFQKIVPSVEDIRLLLGILLNRRNSGMPIRHIVVPTDFSETADNAYRYALDLAAFLGASVRLVHVHQNKSDVGSAVLLDGVSEEFYYKQELLMSLSQSAFMRYTNGAKTSPSAAVQPEMLRGLVVDELRSVSKRKDTDLIIMGTTGNNSLLGRWLGSISTQVARKAYCPVLLVPRHCQFEPYKNMVYACGYQPNEEHVLDKILSFAARFKSVMHLVHVNTSRNTTPADILQAPIGEKIEEQGVKLKLCKLANPDILGALTEYAQENKAGLIAMSTMHRPFLEDLFHRSLTREMAVQTSLPLLVIHQNDQA